VTNAIYTQTLSCSGMPVSGRVSTAWTRALPISMGEVAAVAMGTGVAFQGTGVSKHRAANDGTFPGTSVWSPPT
jgi:hypothetical protein